MPLDNLPGKLVIPTRDQRVALYKRAVTVRTPTGATPADMRAGGQIDIDAHACADVAATIDSNAVIIASGVSPQDAIGADLDAWAARRGTARQPAYGGAGSVGFVGSTAGATIFAGDVITHLDTGFRFQCTTTGTYTLNQPVPISGIDTGYATNLSAGTILAWRSPRPGCADTATVVQQADGGGLEGGAPPETDQQLRARLAYFAAFPPASGNDAEYQKVGSETNLVAIQQIFTYPAILGPGMTGVVVLLRPGTPGASRIPTATQLALVAQQLGGLMPATDGIFLCTVVASPVVVVLEVQWAPSAAGWADATTWPPYIPSPNLVVALPNAGAILSATQFRVYSTGLSSSTAPQVGQSIAFYDAPNLTYRRKKILTVTAIGGFAYDLTIDTTNGISDTSYTPISGQACCPWSDSLNSAILPVVSYFDTLGPGEQVSSFFDAGLRQKRSPASPLYWPSTINNRLLGGAVTQQPPQGPQQTQPPVPTLLSTQTLADVELIEPAIPYATPIGTPSISSYLLTLSNLLLFPE